MNSIYEVRILIVDDNKDLLRLLCEQLSGAGYRHIQTAANCAAAKKLFAAEIPELMILDINLPDGDGFSLFRDGRDDSDDIFTTDTLYKIPSQPSHIVTLVFQQRLI